jgi:hypothetical protein
MTAPRCTYHCRACGAHFTSLKAFDYHHESSGASLKPCVFPEGHGLVERTGVCKLSSPTQTGVTIYEAARAEVTRTYWNQRRDLRLPERA